MILDIILQKKIKIESNDTGGNLLSKFQREYFDLIKQVLDSIKEKKLKLIVQKNDEATYFAKRTPADGIINWDWQKERIRNWVRAQSIPYPGAFTHCNDIKIIIDEIIFSDLGYNSEQENGTVLSNKNGIIVKCQNGAVFLKNVRNICSAQIPIGSVLK